MYLTRMYLKFMCAYQQLQIHTYLLDKILSKFIDVPLSASEIVGLCSSVERACDSNKVVGSNPGRGTFFQLNLKQLFVQLINAIPAPLQKVKR